jgi:hypothetical protein
MTRFYQLLPNCSAVNISTWINFLKKNRTCGILKTMLTSTNSLRAKRILCQNLSLTGSPLTQEFGYHRTGKISSLIKLKTNNNHSLNLFCPSSLNHNHNNFHFHSLRLRLTHWLHQRVTEFCIINLQWITKNYTRVLRENANH